MSRTKQALKRRSMAVPVLGAAGLSLALANAASAAVPKKDMLTPTARTRHAITLHEEEISDVSLATFYVFGNEGGETFRPGLRLAAGGACAGCAGCGGCWAGSYDYPPPPLFGGGYYPPEPTRPWHRHVHKRRHIPKKP